MDKDCPTLKKLTRCFFAPGRGFGNRFTLACATSRRAGLRPCSPAIPPPTSRLRDRPRQFMASPLFHSDLLMAHEPAPTQRRHISKTLGAYADIRITERFPLSAFCGVGGAKWGVVPSRGSARGEVPRSTILEFMARPGVSIP